VGDKTPPEKVENLLSGHESSNVKSEKRAILQELGGMRVHRGDEGADIWADSSRHARDLGIGEARDGYRAVQEKPAESEAREHELDNVHHGVSVSIDIDNSRVEGGIRVNRPVKGEALSPRRSRPRTGTFEMAMDQLHQFVQSLETNGKKARGGEGRGGIAKDAVKLKAKENAVAGKPDDWMKRSHGIHVVMSISDYEKLMARMARRAQSAANSQSALIAEAPRHTTGFRREIAIRQDPPTEMTSLPLEFA
jgi:hypothetical protein